MDLKITPTGKLSGTINISGSKNGTLPMLAASLLCDGTVCISDIPDVSDIRLMCKMLMCAGASVCYLDADTIKINPSEVNPYKFNRECAGKIRGSFLLSGACLGKYGYAKIPMPGGCPIGTRPIDLHLKGFCALGADISAENGIITMRGNNLVGTDIYLDFPSVGATENIMLAACCADGKTVISNASAEPEICTLADMLIQMGVVIDGAGTDQITIYGKKDNLSSVSVKAMPDRIEAGTYMMLIASTGGKGILENVDCSHLTPVTAKLREMGAQIHEYENSLYICAENGLECADIKTMPYPGFPTDMQAPFCALLCTCHGRGMIVETVFENRFLHVGELIRMGASIKTDGRTAIIEGDTLLTGAAVRCRDLRGGAALIIAAANARGSTVIHDARHIMRGYDNIETKLNHLGCRAEFV